MPDLDVTFVLADIMFSDSFDVLRRADVIDAKGRTTPTVVETFPEQYGVITAQDPADLMRRDDGQMMPRLIFVATPFRLRGVATGCQPDIIVWNGSQYTVKHLLDYSRYGEGFTEAIAEVMQATTNPIT